MIDCGSFEYAQARLQSRHGQRATASHWQQLETTREFADLLDTARGGALRPWVAGLTAQSTSTQIESALRARWRATVTEVVSWMPGAWQPALEWCAVLPELPMLQHLARGGEPEAWMHADPPWHPVCAAPVQARQAIVASSSWRALACAWARPATLAVTWQAEWERRLPLPLRDAEESLRQLAAALRSHGAAFAAAPPGTGALLRRALQARLSLLLRHATLQPAAAFIHLALCALDLERLRGELLRRRLFPRAKVA